MIDFINGDKFRGMTGLPIEYRDTHDYWNILNYIVRARKDPAHVYKLITHNSDWSVGKAMAGMGIIPEELPFNLRWFAQNVDIEHPNIESIPIGLENPQWHPLIQKTQKISYCMKYNTKFYTNMCMAQFNPNTNPRRREIYDHFSQFDCAYLTKQQTEQILIDTCQILILVYSAYAPMEMELILIDYGKPFMLAASR